MAAKKYMHAVIATDVVIFTIEEGELKVLLIQMKKHPYENAWALPGGLIHGDESLETSAQRQLVSKTGVKHGYLEQLASFGDPKRDPFGRVVSVAYFALIPIGTRELKTTEEYGGVAWFSTAKLPKLAYDHRRILGVALARLQSKLAYTNIVQELLPKTFTLTELQKVYEIVLGRKLDKRNFRKKILDLELVAATGAIQKGKASRPAALYHFLRQKGTIVDIL